MIVLDKKGLSLNGKEPLGKILTKLKQKKVENRLVECLDLDLRNAIGHGWYWVDKNKFYYTVDPTLLRAKSLSIVEFLMKVRESFLLTYCFMNTAFDRVKQIRDSKV